MAIQRKVFRIEQMTGVAAADGAPPTADIGESVPERLRQINDKSDAIQHALTRTKQEIAILHAGTFRNGRPRATRELDAVASGAERATQQILDAAEVIEEAAKLLAASVKQNQDQALAQDIQDNVLRIFEACNFQDLSGQRIYTKVLAMLEFVEDRITRTMEIWGGAEAFRDNATAIAEALDSTNQLHGPKLDDDPGHASQADVDALFKTG